MHRLLHTVRTFIQNEDLIPPEAPVLVGLSGGVDSIVLVDALQQLHFQVSALHVNFLLRGEASNADEAFVRSFCQERSISLEVIRRDAGAASEARGGSVQETARAIRYEAFEEAAVRNALRHVAVGHHRDDQAETVLLNLFRGTGPEGLAGMPVKRSIFTGSDIYLVRPLLALRRAEIEGYARERELTWREDATNLKPAYRRGAIRGHVLPVIEGLFGEAASENVARSADLMRAYVEAGLEKDVADAFEQCADRDADDDAGQILGSLDLRCLRRLDGVMRGRVILEAIRRWLPSLGAGQATVAEVERLLDRQPGRRLEHPGGTIWRERGRLLFVQGDRGAAPAETSATGQRRGVAADRHADQKKAADTVPIELTLGEPVETPIGRIEVEMDTVAPERLGCGDPFEEYVDADRLAEPRVTRPWRSGDRFVPLGMEHPKKLSDFLTDEKVPPHRRSMVYVVEAGGEIVWVVGLRIAQSVRVRPETKRFARFRFHPTENTSTASA